MAAACNKDKVAAEALQIQSSPLQVLIDKGKTASIASAQKEAVHTVLGIAQKMFERLFFVDKAEEVAAVVVVVVLI